MGRPTSPHKYIKRLALAAAPDNYQIGTELALGIDSTFDWRS